MTHEPHPQTDRGGSDGDAVSLPMPYYAADGVTIYNADCRPILATLDPARVLVIADPPYGVGYVVAPQIVGVGNRRILRGGKPPVIGDDGPFDPSPLLRFDRLVTFGANHYSDRLPVSGGWFVWDKTGGGRGPDNSFADAELAWTSLTKTPRIFSHLWKGLVRDTEAGEQVEHPTQKPVALAKWIISRYARPGDTIVEPYMGAGFATVAAHQLGYPSIACELVEDYCKVVVRRVSQRVLDFAGGAA